MKYTIFSLDETRKHYTTAIERYFHDTEFYYRSFRKVNGRVPGELEKAQVDHPYLINFPEARVGHLGIWYTVLYALDEAPIVTFEDDALLGPNFNLNWAFRFPEIPDDADFFSLFLPRDSDHLWNESMSVSKRLTRTYQRYGGVSMYYTERGKENIKSLLRRDGITGQYDDTLYAYAKAGELNGYCSKPTLSDLVYITGTEESTVQNTEKFN